MPPRGSEKTEWVRRFGRTERFAHWWTVSMVAAALLTGLGVGDEGEAGTMLTAHIAAVVLIGAGLAAALLLGNRRALLRAAWRLFTFDRRDVAWIRARLRRPLGGGEHVEAGLFNAGQKLLTWALTIAVATVIVTGIQAANAGGSDGSGHGAAVVVAMSLVGVHIFMAALNPSTRPALNGMVFGRVRRSWAAEHHGEWLSEVDHHAFPGGRHKRS